MQWPLGSLGGRESSSVDHAHENGLNTARAVFKEKPRLTQGLFTMDDKSAAATPHVPIIVAWTGGAEFDASREEGGPRVHIDGDAKQAPSPVDLLLASIATCAATDVVTILQK